MSRRAERVLVLTIAGVALIGLVDAAVVREPDLLALFACIVVLCTLWLLSVTRSRRLLSTRADLVAWLQRRADVTGEPLERIADRALATYRHQVEGASVGSTTHEGTGGARQGRAQ